MNIQTLKDYLVNAIEAEAYWRDQKAQKYPYDDRNKQRATALRALADRVGVLPVDEPKLFALWERWHSHQATTDDGVPMTLDEPERDVLRLYGFNAPDDDGDPASFLDDLIGKLEYVWTTQ